LMATFTLPTQLLCLWGERAAHHNRRGPSIRTEQLAGGIVPKLVRFETSQKTTLYCSAIQRPIPFVVGSGKARRPLHAIEQFPKPRPLLDHFAEDWK